MTNHSSVESIKEIPLPELGEGVTSGELAKWLVKKGDKIHTDQVLAEVMTDKAAMEISSPYDGVVEDLLIQEGDTVEVGHALLALKTSAQTTKKNNSEVLSSFDIVDSKKSPSVQSQTDESKKSQSVSTDIKNNLTDEIFSFRQDSVLAAPVTRRLAKKLGVDLRAIKGSGLAGRITKEDLEKHSSLKIQKDSLILHSDSSKTTSVVSSVAERVSGFSIPEEESQQRSPLKGIRKKIAEKMQLSNTIIPHFTLLESANMEQVDSMKSSVKDMLKEKNVKVTYLSFVMKALLEVIKEFPELNASIDDVSQEIVIKKYYHFGFAADTPRGLLVPVIKDVDKKSLTEISVEIQKLAVKAREGQIKLDEMKGGTITVTNIGSLGGEYATPIINAPETAILGMYRLFIKPHWDGSAFQPRKTMNFSLTCDHRLIDGAVSAKALKYFINTIENPFSLFI